MTSLRTVILEGESGGGGVGVINIATTNDSWLEVNCWRWNSFKFSLRFKYPKTLPKFFDFWFENKVVIASTSDHNLSFYQINFRFLFWAVSDYKQPNILIK